jgi:hypothetical protein
MELKTSLMYKPAYLMKWQHYLIPLRVTTDGSQWMMIAYLEDAISYVDELIRLEHHKWPNSRLYWLREELAVEPSRENAWLPVWCICSKGQKKPSWTHSWIASMLWICFPRLMVHFDWRWKWSGEMLVSLLSGLEQSPWSLPFSGRKSVCPWWCSAPWMVDLSRFVPLS